MRILFLCCMLCNLVALHAQPVISWELTLGSSNWDELHCLLLAKDAKGYYIGGNLAGTGGSVQVNNFGGNDYYISRTDLSGQKVWERNFGGDHDDRLWGMKELANGDLLLGGSSFSGISGNKTSESFGGADYWLLRIDKVGQIIWEQHYGGSGDDHLFDVAENQDGTILLVGYSNSTISGNKMTAEMGGFDGWVLKVDQNGQLLSQNAFGGDNFDNLYTITPTVDGGYLLGGSTASHPSETISHFSRGSTDYYIVKIDENGLYEWDARFGGHADDQVYAVKALHDGNFVLCGGSASGLSIDKSTDNLGSYDYWIIKMNPKGKMIWEHAYGGTSLDVAYDIVEMPGGHLYVGGVSDSGQSDLKASPTHGFYDYWLAYLDQNGNRIWDKSYGGAGSDAMTKLLVNPDYSLTLGGHSASQKSFDKSTDSYGFNDWWLMRTACSLEFDLSPAATFCPGAPLQLNANTLVCSHPPCQFIWNDSITTNDLSFKPKAVGNTHAIARDWHGCVVLDTILLESFAPFSINLGNDTTIFKSQSVLLDPMSGITFDSYLWSNGQNSTSILVNETGIYALTVSDTEGCTAQDSIYICACGEERVYIANVFQPDDDVNNDIWFIQSAPGIVKSIKQVEVYNAWGTMVYQAQNIPANDRDYGWDGYHQGKACRPGVYTYATEIEYSSGFVEVQYGTVTIVY